MDLANGQISGYVEFEIEKILGKVNDPVSDAQIKALHNICKGYLARIKEVNETPNPFGFLDIMALIAYFGELTYGECDMKLDSDVTPVDRSEQNRRRFCKFMSVNMSQFGRSYSGISGEIYQQIRNGLAHCMMLFPNEEGSPRIMISHNIAFRAKKDCSGKLKFQRRDLADDTKVTILCAEDLISDMENSVNELFADQTNQEQLVRFSRTHVPIIGTDEFKT